VVQDYPAARVRLEAIAAKKLEKYKKVPLEKGAYNLQTYCMKEQCEPIQNLYYFVW
jgi:hypothetical protein